jgi:hypothetical protein
MNKTLLSLLIFILLISLNIKAETFSLFGVNIGSKLNQELNPNWTWGQVDGPMSGYYISPPVTNSLMKDYIAEVHREKETINAIWGYSVDLNNEKQCLKIRLVFESAIKKTNIDKRQNYNQISSQFPSVNTRVIKYKSKVEGDDKEYVFSLICQELNNKYHLNIGVEKKYTIIDVIEEMIKDEDKIDISGL